MESEEESELVPKEEIPEEKQSILDWIKESTLTLKYYTTSKDVRILDRRLGYIYYTSLALIVTYLVVVVFIINQQYLDTEKVEGSVYVTLLGQAYSTGSLPYVWDVPEENPWGPETAAVFVPSKVILTRKQFYGVCADPLLFCETNADCSPVDLPNVIEGSSCLDTAEGTKGCLAWKWCPPDNSMTSTVYYLENAAHQIVWVRLKVEFSRLTKLSKDTLDSDHIELYPGANSDSWEVNDIALMAGFNFSDITEKGAVVQATIVLGCISNPTENCDTRLEVKRLDSVDSGGYSISFAEYYREGDTLYRDLYHMKGVRILFSSVGVYVAASLFNMILQLASALGLIIACNAITDGVMLNLLKEKTHFQKLKVKDDKDFKEER